LVQTNYENEEIYQSFFEHILSAGFSVEEFGQFPACFLIGKRRHIFFGHDHNVMPRGKQVFVAAEEFPNQSFHAIAKNGVARFFRNSDSQAFDSIRVAACYNSKESRTSPDPLFVNNPIAALIGDLFRSTVRLLFHAWNLSPLPDDNISNFIRLNFFCLWLFCGLTPAGRF
jgi:hypothetical protein